jgi:hypothetical protein
LGAHGCLPRPLHGHCRTFSRCWVSWRASHRRNEAARAPRATSPTLVLGYIESSLPSSLSVQQQTATARRKMGTMTSSTTSLESLPPRGPTTTTLSPSPRPPTTSSHGTNRILLCRSHRIVPPVPPPQHSLEPEEVINSWELMDDFLDPSTPAKHGYRKIFDEMPKRIL